MTIVSLEVSSPPEPVKPADDKRTERLLAAYTEVCRSYQAVDDFRAKLLGILPITSLAGILLVSDKTPLLDEGPQKIIGFGSAFAAAFSRSRAERRLARVLSNSSCCAPPSMAMLRCSRRSAL